MAVDVGRKVRLGACVCVWGGSLLLCVNTGGLHPTPPVVPAAAADPTTRHPSLSLKLTWFTQPLWCFKMPSRPSLLCQ